MAKRPKFPIGFNPEWDDPIFAIKESIREKTEPDRLEPEVLALVLADERAARRRERFERTLLFSLAIAGSLAATFGATWVDLNRPADNANWDTYGPLAAYALAAVLCVYTLARGRFERLLATLLAVIALAGAYALFLINGGPPELALHAMPGAWVKVAGVALLIYLFAPSRAGNITRLSHANTSSS